MELIYLWLNNYKGLKDFGVTLNASYEECTKKYSKTSKQTVIYLKEKTNYLNIFPQNINVTTLVGGNGSGKSNIVTALNKIIHSIRSIDSRLKFTDNYDDTPMPKEYCLILKQKKSYIAYCSDINAFKLTIATKENNKYNAIYSDQYKDLNRDIPFEIRRIKQAKNKKISSAMFQPFLRKEEDYQNDFPTRNDIYDIARIKLNNYFYYDRFRLYDAIRTIQELYKFNDSLLEQNKLKLFKEYPYLYFDKYSPYLNIYDALQWIDKQIQHSSEHHPLKSSISNSINFYCKNISEYNNVQKLQEKLLPKLFFYYAFSEILYDKEENEKKETQRYYDYEEALNNLPTKDIPNKAGRLDFYTTILEKDVPTKIKEMLIAYVEYETNKPKANRLSLKDYFDKYYDISYNDIDCEYPILQLKKPVSFTTRKRYPSYVTQIERLKGISKNLYKTSSDKKNYDFLSLSTGEQRILRFFADIYLSANMKNLNYKQKEPENNLFIFDEMDLSWHPEWQRNMVHYVLNIFKRIISKKNLINNTNRTINIIFTTHSPFILSDMPKDNVILLKKGQDGNTEIVHNATKTFATNIHTLFANSFIMKSTVGEFAQNQLQSIAKQLNSCEALDKAGISKLETILNHLDDDNIYKKILETNKALKKAGVLNETDC